MGGREEAVRRHNREVVDHLRRRLAEERPPAGPMWPEYRLLAEEVRLEERAGEETVVVRFRLTGDGRRFGFRVELSEAGDPSWEDPIITAETILAVLDEAVLAGQRSAPDPEGVVWVS